MLNWSLHRLWLLGVVWQAASGQSGYLNMAPGVAYVGSKVCAGCHRRIYDDYVRSAMGRSMRPAGDAQDLARVPGPVTIRNGNRFFEIRRQGDELYESEYEPGPSQDPEFKTSYKLQYAVGSGVNGSTYIVRRGNYLFEAPLSFFARTRAWELSPGYESGAPGFGRSIAAACVVCHSGRSQAIRGREGLFGDVPFPELAIGCENCHGPGALHVRERGRANAGIQAMDRAIVNPARLPARLAGDICINCHQEGDARVLLPGRDYTDFRPGSALGDTVAIFKIPLSPETAKLQDLLEQQFAMQLSKCFLESGGRLRCLTCHDPHAMPAPENAGDYYRRKCLACHTESSCTLPRRQRLREAADHCARCHMPKREVGVVAHSALTNHRIIARPDEPLPAEAFKQTTPDLPDLIFLNRNGARKLPKLTLLQAYGELMGQAPRYRPRYLELLADLSHSQPDEPVVQAALGRKAFLASGPEANRQAIEHLSKAVRLGFTGSLVYENLAEALFREDRVPEAIEVLTKGIDLVPYAPRLQKFLAACYINRKQYELARQVMKRYTELFPDDDFVRGLLRKVESQP
ncbi:MAG: tetratricopeptide repeat protein [Pseudomonadota bacterium]